MSGKARRKKISFLYNFLPSTSKGQGHVDKSDHVNHKHWWWYKMVARNGKSMMILVKLPILRPLLLRREILWWLEISKILKDLYGWVATQPYKSFKIFELSKVHKISRLRNSGLKIGILTNVIMFFPFLASTIYFYD